MVNTNEIHWADIYDKAVTSFGGSTPGQQLEADILTHFREHPAATQAAITKIADRFTAGKIHSPWPLVLRELDRDDNRDGITARDDHERQTAIRLTEIYITNAGLYLPTEAEVIDDTFGDHGRLKQWADDPDLQERIVQHWRDQQPRAEAAIADSLERAAKFNAGRAQRLAAKQTPPQLAKPPTDDIAW